MTQVTGPACRACGAANRAGRRFCAGCGAPLLVVCAGCGAPNEPTDRFCGGCGESLSRVAGPPLRSLSDPRSYTPKHLADKILQSKSALEDERKQVTFLFSDVNGSMELAEQLDLEQRHTILDRLFSILTDGVHRFERTVNPSTGGGIMTRFGAPIAHEDHAQRGAAARS